jgi:hypothetical protein
MNGPNYLFVFIKKKYPIWKKIRKEAPQYFDRFLEKMIKNTEGPFCQILKDRLVNERTKLPLRFY